MKELSRWKALMFTLVFNDSSKCRNLENAKFRHFQMGRKPEPEALQERNRDSGYRHDNIRKMAENHGLA